MQAVVFHSVVFQASDPSRTLRGGERQVHVSVEHVAQMCRVARPSKKLARAAQRLGHNGAVATQSHCDSVVERCGKCSRTCVAQCQRPPMNPLAPRSRTAGAQPSTLPNPP